MVTSEAILAQLMVFVYYDVTLINFLKISFESLVGFVILDYCCLRKWTILNGGAI